ncbi:MAG TPA: hypothetical protein VFB08_14465 [Burkholderiales bacterium]|nr:hypothetical protein [Burkholderiales bacterium]
MKRKRARDPRVEAMRLLGKWTTLGQGHVVFGGAGCSCGVAAPGVSVQDLEEQILEYLRGKYPAAAGPANVAALLRAIAAQPAGVEAESLALLGDLERTLESFDELHRVR